VSGLDNGEPVAAFLATALEHDGLGRLLGAGAKTVGAGAAFLTGLKGSFWHEDNEWEVMNKKILG
jgi:hypothetical protein